jgi:hypothetical protein
MINETEKIEEIRTKYEKYLALIQDMLESHSLFDQDRELQYIYDYIGKLPLL